MIVSPDEVNRVTRQTVELTSKQAARHTFLLQGTLAEDATNEVFMDVLETNLAFLRNAVRGGLFDAGFFPDAAAVAHFVAAAEVVFAEEYNRLCRGFTQEGRGRA